MTVVPVLRYFNPTLAVTIGLTTVTFAQGEGLSMSFAVERSLSPTPDTAQVSIANLDPARSAAMFTTFSALGALSLSQLTIRAGYDGVTAGLFSGDLRKFVSARREGPDIYTDAIADDGGNAVADVLIPPYARSSLGRTPRDLIDTALALIAADPKATPITAAPSVAEVLAAGDQRPNLYATVSIGKVTDLLDEAARRLYCRWRIRDLQLHLSYLNQPDRNRPALLIKPRQIVGDVSFGGSGELNIPVLLDPNIIPGGQVQYLATSFRVEHVVHSGATRGGLWTSTIRGRAL